MPSQIITEFKNCLKERLKFYANQGLTLEAMYSLNMLWFITSFQAPKVLIHDFKKNPIGSRGNGILV